jgi:hypothetical protein
LRTDDRNELRERYAQVGDVTFRYAKEQSWRTARPISAELDHTRQRAGDKHVAAGLRDG